jgi:hypothetical protein
MQIKMKFTFYPHYTFPVSLTAFKIIKETELCALYRQPDEVDFFNLPNPSSCTMALGLTQPLTEMSTRNLPAG